jgi:hypothetical protein
MDIYEQFIAHLLELEKLLLLEPSSDLEKHHILPFHDGGCKSGSTVYCSSENHTLAHYYRYLSYGQKGDFVAFTMRWNQKIGIKERVALSIQKNKQLQNKFWNANWQSEQGKKGGRIGGLKNSLKQQAARSRVGLTAGYGLKTEKQRNENQRGGLKNSLKQQDARSRVGIQKQSFVLRQTLLKETVWLYKTKKDFFFVTVPPQKSFVALMSFLESKVPSNKIKNKASFYNLVHGRSLKSSNWSFWFIKFEKINKIDTAICSQAEGTPSEGSETTGEIKFS